VEAGAQVRHGAAPLGGGQEDGLYVTNSLA
jgi:hypothetical protein